jgi:DNA primase
MVLNSVIDEIKNKINIVELVSEYIELKKSGVNYKALCPFHSEKTPSFVVNEEKQIWHCFGCNEGGDIFVFIQKMEGLEFPEALRLLAKKAGVVLKKNSDKMQTKKNILLDICQASAQYFYDLLKNDGRAFYAKEYLKKRNLNLETINNFKIGYALEAWQSLKSYLNKKGFKDEDIFLAGMVVQNKKRQDYYDRFRNRIIFPISDIHDQIVGFSARILDEKNDKLGKYINSPQTKIFNKSYVLYGMSKAKQPIKIKNLAVIVEGQIDVIQSHQAGIKNVVATSGTALTKEHLNLLKRYANNVGLCFDQDEAGMMAQKKAVQLCLKAGLNTNIISLQFSKDPDECIKRSVNKWEEAIEKSVPAIDFYLDYYFNVKGLSIYEKKKNINEMLQIIKFCVNSIERDYYLEKLSQYIGVKKHLIMEEYNRSVKVQRLSEKDVPLKNEFNNFNDYSNRIIDSFLGILFLNHKLFVHVSSEYDEIVLHYLSEEKKIIYSTFKKCYNDNSFESVDDLFDYIENENVLKEARRIYILIKDEYQYFEYEALKKEFLYLASKIKEIYLKTRLNQLSLKIKEAEVKKDYQQIEKLTEICNILLKEFNNS